MTGTYRLAGLNIAITSVHDTVQRMCEAYRTEDAADVAVESTEEDIRFERARMTRENERTGTPAQTFSDPYLETLAVYRRISERLPDFDAFLMHGSCLAADGEAFLFTAKSGTGKSTHARLWRETLGERVIMVNDDKPLIRFLDGRPFAFGTPWDGKHRLSSNTAVPLRAVCILERGEQNRIVPITPSEAYPKLVQQIYRPLDGAAMAKTLTLIDRLSAAAALWRMECNMDPEAARMAYAAMHDGIGKE